MAVAVGTSVVASLLVSVGGIAGTGAVGSAGGVGGGGGAGQAMTLLLGVQRMSALSSMPIEKSEIHTSLGTELAWAKGDLGLCAATGLCGESSGARRRRRLEGAVHGADGNATEGNASGNATDSGPTAEAAEMFLFDVLLTLSSMLLLALLVQLAAHLAWRTCVNRRYYATKGKDASIAAPERQTSVSHQIARSMFERHAGSDRQIDAHELLALCKTMGRELDAEEEHELLRLLDHDGSGHIDVDEFIEWWDLGLSMEALRDKKVSMLKRKQSADGRQSVARKSRSSVAQAMATKMEIDNRQSERDEEREERSMECKSTLKEGPGRCTCRKTKPPAAKQESQKKAPGRMTQRLGPGWRDNGVQAWAHTEPSPSSATPTPPPPPDPPAAAPPEAQHGVWGRLAVASRMRVNVKKATNVKKADHGGALTKRLGVGWRGAACPHGGVTTQRRRSCAPSAVSPPPSPPGASPRAPRVSAELPQSCVLPARARSQQSAQSLGAGDTADESSESSRAAAAARLGCARRWCLWFMRKLCYLAPHMAVPDSLGVLLSYFVYVEGEQHEDRFRPFPAALRWPALPTFVVVCSLTGLTQGACTLLFIGGASSLGVAMAIASLAIMIAAMVVMWLQLLRFSRRHRGALWEAERPPFRSREVADPAMRLVSALRSPLGAKAGLKSRLSARPTLPRERGEFSAPEEDTEEPTRTERLLSRPLALFPERGGDALESIAMVMGRGRGDTSTAFAFYLGTLTVQLCLSAMCAVGSALTSVGSAASYVVVVSALVAQLGSGLWLSCWRPGVDRLENLLTQVQYTIESGSTALLLLATLAAHVQHSHLQGLALLFSMAAVVLPLLQKLYDNALGPLFAKLLGCIDGCVDRRASVADEAERETDAARAGTSSTEGWDPICLASATTAPPAAAVPQRKPDAACCSTVSLDALGEEADLRLSA